jgi:hypothetical protein
MNTSVSEKARHAQGMLAVLASTPSSARLGGEPDRKADVTDAGVGAAACSAITAAVDSATTAVVANVGERSTDAGVTTQRWSLLGAKLAL